MAKFKVICDVHATIERIIEAEDEDAALEEVVIESDELEIQEAIDLASWTVEEIASDIKEDAQ